MKESPDLISILLPAFIGSAVALLTLLVKDLLLPRINAKFSKRQSEADLFKEYLHPILSSLEALLWRLDEVLRQPGRGAYLHSSAGNSQYVNYKKISTVYRLCVVVALFRAFERELLGIRSTDLQGSDHLRDAMFDFQAALADGKSIEFQKLDRLAELWGIGKVAPDKRDFTAVTIENEIDKRLGSHKHRGAQSLPASEQRELLGAVYTIVQKAILEPSIDQVRDVSLDDVAIGVLSLRQTWIYRDWQAAIGDAMLVYEDSGPKKFRVLGFGEFEELWIDSQPLWLSRVSGLFLDFDVGKPDETDSRREQLLRIMATSADLIVRLLTDDRLIRKAKSKTWKLAREISEEQEEN